MRWTWKHVRTIACLLWLIGLVACGSSAPAGYITQQQTVDGLTITLERPQQAQLLDSYDLFVDLADASGRPVNDAQIFLDLTMAGMPMGSNQPLAEPAGEGRYRIPVVFTMEGDWGVIVHVRVAGNEQRATFDQVVVPKPMDT